jgi:hypothetical protein
MFVSPSQAPVILTGMHRSGTSLVASIMSSLRLWRKRKTEIFVFNATELSRRADLLKAGYISASPYPHAVIDGLLPEWAAERLVEVFPNPDHPLWLDWTKRDTLHQPRKQGIGHAERLEGAHPFIHNVLFALNSYPMISFLESLTGISGLVPDPAYVGGGLHQILPGGTLSVHADFNYLEHVGLYRRLNLLLYLNKDWKESWGGHLEMWDSGMTCCVKRVAPTFNRCVVFNTLDTAYHGHPEPLSCPAGLTRKSLALYYYSRESFDGASQRHGVLWQDQPAL